MRPDEKQIREIAEYLDCGMIVFSNRDTGAVSYRMDSEHWEILEDDFMEEEIDSSSDNLVEFHGFDTNESYDLMADFAEHVEDEKLKQELQEALNRKKPFRNFKKCLESSSGAFRDEWFSYIQYRHELLVREQIERLMAEDTAGIGER